MEEHVLASLEEARTGLGLLISNREVIAQIAQAGSMLARSLAQGGKILTCGNGGSMCDAMHFAEELSGRYRNNRPALSALAASDAGHLTCCANDFGYEKVFARFVEAHGKPGDVLVGISTSGTSRNVLEAVREARKREMKAVVLTGKPDSPIGVLADIDLCTQAGAYADRVQELHIKVIHILIELIERQLFPANY